MGAFTAAETVTTTAEKDAVIEALHELIHEPRFLAFGGLTKKRYFGRIREDGFKAWPNARFSTNPPRLKGSLEHSAQGTTIELRGTLDPFVPVFVSIWIVGMTAGLVIGFIRDFHLLVPAFCGVGIAVGVLTLIVFVQLLSAELKRFLKSFASALDEALSARA